MELKLADSLDISTVIDSSNQYKEWLSKDTSLVIDAADVARTDAAGIQALTSLFLTAKSNQIDIQLSQPTELLLEGINTLGLQDVFNLTPDVGELCNEKDSGS
ncbi:STAS domain-containing protein [Vibrio sp. TRT 17S01]|uniref:STAS domain-containing protein n=1 Tax=Vibrio sp. TRT 17S01 TaxID=3418505 RepID=UPI003CF30D40